MHKPAILIGALLLGGCGLFGDSSPRAIDLDAVLDIFVEVLDATDNQFRQQMESDPERAAMLAEIADEEFTVEPITDPSEAESVETAQQAFTQIYAGMLNASPERTHYEGTLGVTVRDDGSVLGFHDKDGDGTKGADEPDVFSVEIDAENRRMIATDHTREGFHRDRTYRMRGPGLFTGFLLGSMLGRQQTAGVDTKRFGRMTMAPRGYHATSGAYRSRTSGARGVGGSRSTSFGK